jgi:hypothetical protein
MSKVPAILIFKAGQPDVLRGQRAMARADRLVAVVLALQAWDATLQES